MRNESTKRNRPLKRMGTLPFITHIETNIFDIEEIYPNCTVQVLKNSVTGEAVSDGGRTRNNLC